MHLAKKDRIRFFFNNHCFLANIFEATYRKLFKETVNVN